MNTRTSNKKDWALNKEALDKLLICLDTDEQCAAEKYESIRRKLVAFFESRGCSFSEECTDISISRAARRISEGQEITTTNISSYFLGIAWNVLQEYRKETKNTHYLSTDELSFLTQLSVDPEKIDQLEAERLVKEQRAECLDRCLECLPQESRELIIQYYEGETSQRIKSRRKMAEQLCISSNALGIRALRIRDKLETCTKKCVEQMTEV
jgi:RNA polymerase sigma factor (sigma-70 family)